MMKSLSLISVMRGSLVHVSLQPVTENRFVENDQIEVIFTTMDRDGVEATLIEISFEADVTTQENLISNLEIKACLQPGEICNG